MGYIVRMPQLGMTMEEGVVVEWTVERGTVFEEGDVIAVVESEKTTNDVEAREAGQYIEQFVDVGESVEPGGAIAYVGEEGEPVPDEIEADADNAESEATTTDSGGRIETQHVEMRDGDAKVSPRARTYVRESGIDDAVLADISGSGPDGAVIEADVVEAAESLAVGTIADTDLASAEDVSTGRNIYEERSATGIRGTIANRMTESIEAPQVTVNRRAEVGSLVDLKAQLAEDRGLELSVTDVLLTAAVTTLQNYPEFNAIYEDGIHKLAGNVNVGVAVDIEDGLVTPVIDSAEQRSITELRKERKRLVSLVRASEHTIDDLSDGTFTITNLGHFGVETFDPLLNPPQVAILGVGDIRTSYDPVADEPRTEIGLSLTFDHRAVDGADAARFVASLVDELEHPLGLLPFGDRGRVDGQSGPFLKTNDGPEGDRIATAQSDGGTQATVRSRRFEWAVDESEDYGGKDTAPSPVEQFVGSLSSCLTLMMNHMANRREVDIDTVTVTTKAEPPEGCIERIDVDITVASDADREDVERIVDLAERACYVNQAIDPDIERDLCVTLE